MNHIHDLNVPDNFAKMVDAMRKKRLDRRSKSKRPRNTVKPRDLAHKLISPPPENNAPVDLVIIC